MLVVIGVALLFRATYLTWRDEHRTRVEAEATVKKELAEFTAYINRMAFDEVDGFVRAYLLVSVENIGGSASILHHWRMYVQPPEKLEAEVNMRLPRHGEDVSLITDDSGNEVLNNSSQFISEKAYPDAVEPGHSVRGFLLCRYPRRTFRWDTIHSPLLGCQQTDVRMRIRYKCQA